MNKIKCFHQKKLYTCACMLVCVSLRKRESKRETHRKRVVMKRRFLGKGWGDGQWNIIFSPILSFILSTTEQHLLCKIAFPFPCPSLIGVSFCIFVATLENCSTNELKEWSHSPRSVGVVWPGPLGPTPLGYSPLETHISLKRISLWAVYESCLVK